MTQTPQEWLVSLFSKHDLEKADGRALYKYRTSETEFAALKRVLKTHAEHRLWNKLFVLYAAEWWRRYFDGGHWAWQPIFDSLNIEKPAFNQQTMMIKEGLKSWGRQVYRVNDQYRYLATIVIEGGLPIQTVEKDGWLKRVLYESFRVYSQAMQRYQGRVAVLVEHQAQRIPIPKTMQQDEVYYLLGDIVVELARLKQTHQLGDVQSPIETLDAQNESWRDAFPLPIDTDEGWEFINDLLSEVARATPAPLLKYPFQARRVLKETPQGWALSADITLPETASIDSLGLSENDKANLLSRMQVSVETSLGVKKRFATAYNREDKNGLRFSDTSLSLSEQDATAGINLCLSAEEPIILPMTKGEALEDDLPWVFTPSGEEWDYVGQASQKVSADTALVVVKGDLRPSDDTLELMGEVLGGRIYKIRGAAVFENEDEKFRIRTGATDVDGEEYVLEGMRLLFPSTPSWVCLGKPHLYLRDIENHLKRRAQGRLQVKAKSQWERLADTHQGVVSLRFMDSEGYIAFRKRIAILPPKFKISLRADAKNSSRGDIILENVGGLDATVTDTEVQCNPTQSDGAITLGLHSTDALPPARISLRLIDDLGQGIAFSLPFPSNGVRAFDAHHRPLPDEAAVFLDQLAGIRFHLFNGQDGAVGRYQMQMNLHDDDLPDTSEIYFDEIRNCGKETLELALIDYDDRARTLLSISKNLNAFVSITISLSAQEITLNIYQYAAEMKQATQSGCVSLEGAKAHDDLENTVVLAALINNPDPPVLLEPLTSGGAHRAVWDFSPQTRKDGYWVIYPKKAEASAVQFRPLDWRVGETGIVDSATTLQAAFAIGDNMTRGTVIKQLITLMSEDFTHPSWSYIDILWKTMGHLPLPSLDIWRVFAGNQPALVALLFHSNKELLDKMRQEFPIMWELIPMNIWQKVCCCYYKYVKDNIPDVAQDLMIKHKLDYIGDILGMNNLALTLKQSVGIGAQDQDEVSATALQYLL
ncbi:MAG: STY4851/ECs_5259 family protein, partial [Proteobacteria bacterium]|nr:STY4851/ECs_5259 family protein [Pseudomonadota bacterium]